MDSAESANSGFAFNKSEQAFSIDNTEGGIKSPIGSENPPLLPGLPDDIALSCLARVPRHYHLVLSCVSKSWRRLIHGKEFRTYRLANGLQEPWIYALCVYKSKRLCMYVLDPKQSKRRWREIHGFPRRCWNRRGFGFEVLDDKIYLFGGCGWVYDATDEVFCYDASTNKWSVAASLPTPRCYFAHEALGGKIYAIGGLGRRSSNTHSIDVFDSSKNSWTSYPDPNDIKDVRNSLILDDEIYIRSGPSAIYSEAHVLSYDPSNYTSQNVHTDKFLWWGGETVVIGSTLYDLDQSTGVRLIMWHKDTKECIGVRRLSTNVVQPPCHLMAIGENVVVIGKGLSTMIAVDVECANSFNGVMVNSSSLRPISDDYVVLRCKSLSV